MEDKSSAGIQSSEDIVKRFQTYLRKYENDDKLVILEAVEKPATSFANNWMSILMRTKLIGTRGDGRSYTKSFMKKTIRKSKVHALFDFSPMYRTEAYIYLEILPILGSFGPQCVYADKDVIIMEDLTERGYIVCEKRNYLDLDHAIFTLKKLAKFHASTLVVKINNPQQFDTLCVHLEELVYKDNSETSRSVVNWSMKLVIKYLDTIEPHTQELQTIKDYITTYSDKIYDIICRMFAAPKQKYDTICHGDLWINNLLFLHDKDDRIIDLKIIDYQMVRYTSISTDIFYLIYSSIRSSLIERSFESLIKIYHNEFLNELRQLHVDEKILKELGMEWLEKELQSYKFYGLMIACFLINAVLMEEDNMQQFETMDFNDVMSATMQIDMNLEINQKKLDRIKCVVFHYYRRFHLGIINDDIEPISVTG